MEAGAIGRREAEVNLSLSRKAKLAKACVMDSQNDKLSREERLAAKLRENLRRRKTQGREIRESDQTSLPNKETER